MTRLFQRVFVTGGAGYCGSRLVPQLLAHGYYVTVYDIMYFGGHFLPRHHPQLQVIEGDIRDTTKLAGAVAGSRKGAWLAGAATACGLAVGIEGLIFLGLIGASFALRFALDPVPSGITYQLSVSATGYEPKTVPATLFAGQDLDLNITLLASV